MFDNQNVAKRIKQARIEKNMTQMNLADAMGVSFQAVSNWERGNSMPDISKLEELCAALDLTVQELLGMDAAVVEKAMGDEPMTVEELVQVAPMLLPKTVQIKMEASRKDSTVSLEQITELAPSLEENYVDQLVREADTTDWEAVDAVAPFISAEALSELVEKADLEEVVQHTGVLCFLNEAGIDRLVQRGSRAGDLKIVEKAAVYASKGALDKVVDDYIARDDGEKFPGIGPFLGDESLRRLAQYWVEKGDSSKLHDILPFLADADVDELVRQGFEKDDFKLVRAAAVHASKACLAGLVDDYIAKESGGEFPDIAPFLKDESLQKLAQYWMGRREMKKLRRIAPFL